MTLSPQEREDDSVRCYEVGIEAIRKELEISRKALAEIAAGITSVFDEEEECDVMVALSADEMEAIAQRALEEIQEARRG